MEKAKQSPVLKLKIMNSLQLTNGESWVLYAIVYHVIGTTESM